ncbi:hypothetical protein [Candidatus Uabimicrobium amorphum]|uniref:PEGA domain-containing protein n=1 Tax=Uabimicrobium amorphum TaxID=2596890 RepID=A0A5S9ILZ5_UABAM|nr:hypothetical protein [Candidatus Uabimicrobium amorphum]BBM84348.1 hypothetical protein UABAM_02707 [Candidatus Uabimicrobium amorphum]
MLRFTFVFVVICALSTLSAQYVQVKIDITHDVAPPQSSSHPVAFIDAKTQIHRLLTNNRKIFPGVYDIKIKHPGYETVYRKQQQVSGPVFVVKEKLIAKKRQISFEPTPHIGCAPCPYTVIDMQNQQKVELFRETFAPGKFFHFKILFKAYKTVEVKGVLPVGEDLHIVKIPVTRLNPLEFTIRKNKKVIDEIPYEYHFTVEDKLLEAHHIITQKGIGRYYYTVMIGKSAALFRAYLGYTFVDKPLKDFRNGMNIGRPNQLSITRFIAHLQKVYALKRDDAVLVEIIENFFKEERNRNMLKRCSKEDVAKLLDYISTWKVENAQGLVEKVRKMKR